MRVSMTSASRNAASNETALLRTFIPVAPGASQASKRKYPSSPKCSAPASIKVWRERVATCNLLFGPKSTLARISSMAVSPKSPRATPRISANDLALYMVSSETARLGIVRRAKSPQTPPLIRYKDARPPIVAYLTDANRRVNPLTSAEEMFRQRADDRSQGPLRQDDALKSIEVLRSVHGMANRLAEYDFHAAPEKQPKLIMEGVEVSIRADMLVYGSTRGREQIGAALLRMTQDDAETEEAKEKRRNMGLYVATMIRRHVDDNFALNREATNCLCLSIDIQHGEVFVAPNANARRVSDLESACLMIAAIWDRA